MENIKIKALHESINLKGKLPSKWNNKRYSNDEVKQLQNVVMLTSVKPTEEQIQWAKDEIQKCVWFGYITLKY